MSRRSVDLRGILAAVSTPFTPDGSAVDEPEIARQVERMLAAGVHGLVPTGTTGEFTTLSVDEHKRVTDAYVRAVAGRVPVVSGVGALSTGGAIDLAHHAERAGADAVMLVPPFYDPLDITALTGFLSDVAESITIPIVYYNVPGATGIRLNAAQLAEIGRIPGVDYLKDTSGDAVEFAALLAGPHREHITAFNGWDTLTFFGIASGAQASVWGVAGIVPELAVGLWDALAVRKDLDDARERWGHLWAISDFLESVNYVAGVKAGLELIGQPVGPPRQPIQPLADEDRERFARILADAGVLVGARP
ncbi:dihydrodipicolinate synthase family protein [Microbacterium hydrocarbonoxydans]|uniref:Dihydrodipicolinate synthase/N-acetylneuraminate lyase n=1 Tax=Microbacterium hydrocarbonoxydans TaxID=273678 RepID=A0A1H4L672_9MICO|nr:dihydrodipicolinate synthase family protein [Microbacterium hydrocarbonoxydans]SEB65976.1 Dihydrodipicolinate synthase/N-acetylneuraminate lyase [Microbacterium hydrocarbonoxydans]